MKNVVTIGGGTGSFVVLSALKNLPNVKITALVTTADDGGIARIERDQFGILPQSDLRKAIVALADNNENAILRKLFTYRFANGIGFEGNTLGNLILAALTDIRKNQRTAIKDVSKLLKIRGSVEPITLDKTNILITLSGNKQIFGETNLDNPFWDGTKKIKNIQLIPSPKISPHANKKIENADYIFITPGDLYGSVIVNFAVPGVAKAIKKSKAKIVYTCNLVTKYGQTYNYNANDHVTDIQKYLKKKIDIVVLNKGKIDSKTLINYAKEKSAPVTFKLQDFKNTKIYLTDLVDNNQIKAEKGDKLARSIIRHDPKKLQDVYKKIIFN